MSTNDVRKGSIDDITPEEWNSLNDVAVGVRHDPVNNPTHYTHGGGIECIDAIDSMLGHELSLAYYQASVVKYLWRWKYKGGVESLRKAGFFLERMINKECEQGG